MRRAHGLALVGVLALALVATGGAFAGGPPVANETDHVVNGSDTFVDVDPCTGAPAEITITFSGVQHMTIFGDGTIHVTETEHGTFSFDLLPTDGVPDATGTFTNWDGANGLVDLQTENPIGKFEAAFTLNGRGTRSDGSSFSFHNNGHTLLDSLGDPKVDFFKAHCN